MQYNQYGEIAARALQFLDICECAEDAWNNAAMEISGEFEKYFREEGIKEVLSEEYFFGNS